MEWIIRLLLRYRILFLILIVLVTGFFGYFARHSTTDNSIEVWLSKEKENFDYYNHFIDTFGDEEFLLVVIENEEHFSSRGIKQIDRIAKKLEKLDGIKEVISLATVLKDKLSSPHFKNILKERDKKTTIEVFKEEILADEMYVNNIISVDGKITAVIATVAKGSPELRMKLVRETRNIIREIFYQESAARTDVSDNGQGIDLKPDNGLVMMNTPDTSENREEEQSPLSRSVTYCTQVSNNFVQNLNFVEREPLPSNIYLAGPTIVNAELDRMSQRDIKIFMPVMFAIAVIVLILLFRNFSGVLIPIVTISINSVCVVGLFTLFHNKMNMISGMLTPLIFIISLATTIHILNRFYLESEHSTDRQKNIIHSIKEISVPCFLTSATTSIGFLSFVVSDVKPVKTMGIFTAAGVMISFFVCILLLPILFSFIPGKRKDISQHRLKNANTKDATFRGLFGHMGAFVHKHTIPIIIVSLISVCLAVYGGTRIKVESNIFESFPEDSEISRSSSFIERNLMGLLPVEFVIESPGTAGIFKPEVLREMGAMQNYLHTIPEVTSCISVADYVNRLHTVTLNNDTSKDVEVSEEKARNYAKFASLRGDAIVKTLYSKDYEQGRISVRMRNVSSSRYQEIIKNIKKHINTNFPVTIGCTITGIVPLLMDMQGYLAMSQIKTFLLAFIFIFISITLLLKSVRFGLISMIPNLVPIVITLGVMGFLNISLDVATIMIASVAIGISVDDTIHFLYRFRREFQKDKNYYEAIQRTLTGVGKAILFTTIIATSGFLIFCLSSFKPIQHFGLLTGITMVSALISDLFILPSCILLFKPKFL
ncbi:MAG: efflux RND transporter permease subunit [Candidatus Scalindua sp.]|nr:efflux RND transporter permease subunit [Candidatus Scalindua sp.]